MPAASTRTARTEDPAETAPEAKPKGDWWEPLTHLSIGRTPSDKEKAADIVSPEDGKVWLTEEQSHGFLTRHKRPVIRPWRERSEPAPKIGARDLFGRAPSAAQFGAREDPPGSSRVIENPDPSDPANHPEAHDPQTDLNVDPDAAKDK